ncbi:helix-turn-helix domain-containing protein, partial [Thermoanaerobacter sp. A7A]|uniref:helix-turn-helix domain-containing protein n=1 Tax=Thermoanaerobacter sp. A7A TaxID=1350366 RepID=UPI0004A27F54
MDKKTKALELYLEGFKLVEIAQQLGVSQPAVTKMLKQFPEYHQEKERRKKESEKRAKEWRNEYKKQKRNEEKEEEEALYAGMMDLQRQNAMSMSKRRTLSTDTLVKL